MSTPIKQVAPGPWLDGPTVELNDSSLGLLLNAFDPSEYYSRDWEVPLETSKGRKVRLHSNRASLREILMYLPRPKGSEYLVCCKGEVFFADERLSKAVKADGSISPYSVTWYLNDSEDYPLVTPFNVFVRLSDHYNDIPKEWWKHRRLGELHVSGTTGV